MRKLKWLAALLPLMLLSACSEGDENDSSGNGSGDNTEQPGTGDINTPGGSADGEVALISYKEDDRESAIFGYSSSYNENYVKNFEYTDGRVTCIDTRYENNHDASRTEQRFTWAADGSAVDMTLTNTYPGSSGQTSDPDYYRITLTDGRATAIGESDYKGGRYEDYLIFEYDADGRITRWKDIFSPREGGEGVFTYTDGMLTSYAYNDFAYPDENMSYAFTPADYVNRFLNLGPIDFMGLIIGDDDFDYIFHLGIGGRSGKYLPEAYPLDYSDYVGSVEVGPYPTPGEVYEQTSNWVRRTEGQKATIAYEFDARGRITKMTVRDAFEAMRTTRTYEVTSEPYFPGMPEHGYRAKLTDTREESLGQDANVYTYTIEYRR